MVIVDFEMGAIHGNSPEVIPKEDDAVEALFDEI